MCFALFFVRRVVTGAIIDRSCPFGTYNELNLNKFKAFYKHFQTESKKVETDKVRLKPNFLWPILIFYNVLSDCHKSDEMNYLLNAFRLDKKRKLT